MNPASRLTVTGDSGCAKPPWIWLCAPIDSVVRDGKNRIKLVNNTMKLGIQSVAWMRQGNRNLGRDTPRICGKDEDSVAHHDRFFDVVRYQQHRLGGKLMLYPEIEEVGS